MEPLSRPKFLQITSPFEELLNDDEFIKHKPASAKEGISDYDGIQVEHAYIIERCNNLTNDDSLIRKAALNELNQLIEVSHSSFTNCLTPDELACFMKVFSFEDKEEIFLIIEFLTYLTYLFDCYSPFFFTTDFINILLQILPNLPADGIYNCLTVLSNLFTDIKNPLPFVESDLGDFLRNFPEQSLCRPYFRLITALLLIPTLPSKDTISFLQILDHYLGHELIELKTVALKSLLRLLPKQQRKSVKNEEEEEDSLEEHESMWTLIPKCITFKHIIEIFGNPEADFNLYLLALKFIRKIAKSNLDYIDIIAHDEGIDFYNRLAFALYNGKQKLKSKVLKLLNVFIDKDSEFGEEQALLFKDFKFQSKLSKYSYECKIELVVFLENLFKHLSIECIMAILNEEVIEIIVELLDTADEYSKKCCYRFLLQVFTRYRTNQEQIDKFRGQLIGMDIIDVVENDRLKSNEEINQYSELLLANLHPVNDHE